MTEERGTWHADVNVRTERTATNIPITAARYVYDLVNLEIPIVLYQDSRLTFLNGS